ADPGQPRPAPTGSAVGLTPPTGSSEIENPLALEPPEQPLERAPSADVAADSTETDTAAAVSEVATPVDSVTGSAACTGSAILAGSVMLLGSAAGSAILVPALYISAFGVAAMLGSGVAFPVGAAGSVIAGSGPGSVMGSVGMGSAAAGSAGLLCLLSVPTPPPIPEFPLV
ncbi:hypothetical protein ACW9HQ_53135, partial [Nocardia gipuzkoensis]